MAKTVWSFGFYEYNGVKTGKLFYILAYEEPQTPPLSPFLNSLVSPRSKLCQVIGNLLLCFGSFCCFLQPRTNFGSISESVRKQEKEIEKENLNYVDGLLANFLFYLFYLFCYW